PRLVLSRDHLQFWKGQEVVGQVPFANIASIDLADRVVFRRPGDKPRLTLAVILMNRRDPDTYWPQMVREEAHDIEIADIYSTPLISLSSMILDRVEQSHERKREFEDRGSV